jgi:YHS domain-containing protein
MNIDDIMDNQIDGGEDICAVCGKSVEGTRGFTRINLNGSMVPLCCPLCLQTFEANPNQFLHRQNTRSETHAVFDLLRPNRLSHD